jgi:5-methylcytosine-specific restriction endonuclease McrA
VYHVSVYHQDNVCQVRYDRKAYGSTAPTRRARRQSIASNKSIDFYTGKRLGKEIDVDHIIPLNVAYPVMCALPYKKRVEFANAQENLRPTTPKINRGKSDEMPGTWLPDDPKFVCVYLNQLDRVIVKWNLQSVLNDNDKKVIKKANC